MKAKTAKPPCPLFNTWDVGDLQAHVEKSGYLRSFTKHSTREQLVGLCFTLWYAGKK